MHSPVLINCDPIWATASCPSDWEYYSDEYWEREPLKKQKRKRDSDGTTGITSGEMNVKPEPREEKYVGMPEIALGAPTLATSSVVWKSREETLESAQAPIIAEGQMEKVSLVQDWRERVKHHSSWIPNFAPSSSSQNVAMLAGQQEILDMSDENAGFPILSFEETRGLPSRSRNLLESLHESALEDYDELSIYSYDDQIDDAEDGLIQEPATIEEKKKRGSDTDLSVKYRKTRKPIETQTNITATGKLSNEGLQEPAEAIPLLGIGSPSRPKKQKSIQNSDEERSAKDLDSLSNNNVYSKKRKAEEEIHINSTSVVPIHSKKRGRPRKQSISEEIEKQGENDSNAAGKVTTPQGSRKYEKPQKHNPSLLGHGVADCNTGTANQSQPKDVVKRREKRKARNSEDESGASPSKKHSSSRGRRTISAKKGT